MNCRSVRKQLVELFDTEPETALREDLMAHLETCPLCSHEFEEMKRTMERLLPKRGANASPALKETVMKRIALLSRQEGLGVPPRRRFRVIRPLLAAAAAVVLLVGGAIAVWLVQTHANGPISAFDVLGGAVHAMANLESVHIAARVRTRPHENFESIVLEEDFVSVECWKRFSPTPRWRIENPGRVAVMDGESSLLWIKSANGVATGPADSRFAGWLGVLMDVDQVLDTERRLAEEQGSVVTLEHATGADGGPELLVYVEAAAQGDYTNDWCRNTSISDSDNLRIYRLDADTLWLKGLQIYVHTDDGDVLVFETTSVEYNIALDDSLFILDLPDNVSRFEQPQEEDATDATRKLTPEETAQAFFDACAREDWGEVEKYYPVSPTPELIKTYLGKLEIVSIGTPFKSGLYPGWFVPYEIRLNDGKTKKMNLAVRNDNPARQYVVDGGI